MLEDALEEIQTESTAWLDYGARLETLEKAATDTDTEDGIDIEARLAKLEAVPAQEPLDLTAYDARLAALEGVPALDVTDIPKLQARLTQLESSLNNMRAALPIPAFPRDQVLSALGEDGQSGKGWIGRTLSKHVKVADEASTQMVVNIEKSLTAGDIDTALAQAIKLPENGRAAAQDWIDAVSAQRKLP